jgi:uncharacterized phage protein (TIGR02218 family)
MKVLPDNLAAHLRGDATTTCRCWRLTRSDGVVIGFTEHDRDLAFDGSVFLAASGFAVSEGEAAAGLAASADEVTGGFSSAAIRDDDLATGRFDGARVEEFLVNWAEPDMHVLINRREIGEVSRAGGAFRAELRSLAHRLDQPQGRVYARRCDATLGDRHCGIDLAAWQAVATIAEGSDQDTILVSGLADVGTGFFDLGHLLLPDGSKAGIETHRRVEADLARLSLWLPLEVQPVSGSRVTLTAGCDKRFATCKARFENSINFRGFPHLPGADFAYSYIDGERTHDGGVLFE